jgi:hypothetical protein
MSQSLRKVFLWKNKERKIHIVYNFIGTFDFVAATGPVKTNEQQRKTA